MQHPALSGGFCSSSALKSRALLLPSTLNADAPRRLRARIRVSQALSLISFLLSLSLSSPLHEQLRACTFTFRNEIRFMNVSRHIELARLRRKDEDERLPLCQHPATTSRLNGSLQMENVIWKNELFVISLFIKRLI